MSKKQIPEEVVKWRDRRHRAWFPFSFTVYTLTEDRLYVQTGLLSTHYDETLLYRIIDLCLTRTLGQKIFGTGTITLALQADTQRSIVLKNIRHPRQVNRMLSIAVEEARNQRGVIGREFYSGDHAPHDEHEPKGPGVAFQPQGPDGKPFEHHH